MKPRTFFVAVMSPFLLWVALSALLSGWAKTLPDDRLLSVVERTLITGLHAGARGMPYAILAAAGATPVLTLLAAVLVKPSLRGRAGMSAALPWVGVFAGTMSTLFALLAAERAAELALPVMWCLATTESILVVIAFRAQAALRTQGISRVPGWIVLGVGIVLQIALLWPAALLLMLVPVISGWRQLEGRLTNA
jgi:hypothetical protein